ncbi:clathrin light chain B [Egretta garzetta]|uniref:clathrin light chain B n=1 Tax=Egretta garzetta TaxID=188379 RepID=UPI00163C557C|nr:clathrin light chain B [Egretta garzetta]
MPGKVLPFTANDKKENFSDYLIKMAGTYRVVFPARRACAKRLYEANGRLSAATGNARPRSGESRSALEPIRKCPNLINGDYGSRLCLSLSLPFSLAGFQNGGATVNGDVFQESNGPTDAYAAIAKADRLTQEPESIRKWREEQKKRLEELGETHSCVWPCSWHLVMWQLGPWALGVPHLAVTLLHPREVSHALCPCGAVTLFRQYYLADGKDLEEWNLRQNEQMEKNRANNRASEEAFLKESKEETPGSEWEKVAQLCDFNPKSSKQSKDVSRMRSVLISLKQTPLSR